MPVAAALPNKPFDQWSTQSVAEWMSTLNLSSEFNAQKVVDQKIDGSGVLVILDSDAWASFGFTVNMDVLKIKEALKKILVHKIQAFSMIISNKFIENCSATNFFNDLK